MSIVKRTAKASPRIIAIGLLITLLSTFGLAYSLDSVKTFTQLVGASFVLGQTDNRGGQTGITTSKQEVANNKAALGALSGTYNIPGDYADLSTAITDLNASGVSGAVIFNVIAGNPQTSPANTLTTGGGYIIGGSGSLVLTTTSSTNTVTIQGNGNTITAPATHVAGQLNDGIFKIIGADWITITGFTMQENAANTITAAATNNMTEWGVALLYVTATDGANNNTITGNTIDLNRTYQNTFGIYANATHTNTAPTTSATATGAAGGNSGLTITANNITDVNNGIVVVGPTAGADANDGVTIGGTAGTANTLTNFGTTGTFSSYANVSGTVNGILVRNSKNANVSFNSITSSAGGVTAGTLNGIQFPAFSNSPTGTFTQNVNNNTLSLQSGAATGAINGINILGTSSSATSIINVNNNNFTSTFGHTVAASGTITFLTQAGGHFTQSISNNLFNTTIVNTTGSVTFISSTTTLPTGGTKTVTNHTVNGFSKTGAGGTITFYTDNGSSPTGTTTNVTNNTFTNITITGATSVTGISDTDGGATNKNVQNNTVSNISGGTTGTIIGITTNFDGGTTTVSGNAISNITNGGPITGISTGTSGSGGALTTNILQNTMHTLTGTGTGTVTGMSIGGTTGHTKNVSRNKIYNLENNNAAGATFGLTLASGTTLNVFNNLIGDLRTPAVSAANALNGINITSTTTPSTINASFNTIYLNASSTGANFGSSALFHTASATATTANLVSRDNIFVNTSTAAGTGLTAAYRRSSTSLANYDASSNNNLFYAGTPGATNLIFNDGTNSDQTLAAYKARVASRDSSSVTENPPFLSTSGASANFLHINPAVATQTESGGTTVSGITNDYDGDTRNVSTPDIGADEFTGIPLDIVGPAISYTPFGNTTQTTNRNLTVTITDASGVAGGAFAPRIYFRKNGGSYVSTQCTGSSPTYTCTIDYSLVGGVVTTDVIDYFVIAQDTAGNVSINPGAGASATDVNTVTTPPTTPNTYTIVAPFPSTVNVPGDYPSLTNTGGLFEAMNAATFTGNTVINITADLTGELGTVALNQLSEEGAGAGTYTVLIKPSGAPRSITGSINGALIRLNGADRVRFDGSTAASLFDDVVGGNPALRELTIQNTNTGTSAGVISVGSNGTNGAQNNTIKNVNVLGQDPTTTLFGISLGGATPGTAATGPNNNNRVENCSLKRAVFGIYSAGTSAASQNTGTVIAQNETSAVTGDRIRRVGIFVFNENGVQITENSLNGISTNESADGIGIAVGTQSFDTTTTASGGVSNALVDRNKINGVASLSTTGYSAAGITVAGATGGANVIRNNMITGVTAPSTSPDLVAGIYVVGATGSVTRVYHNSVAMTGDRGAVATQMPSFGIAVTGTDPTVELKNNIFYTTQIASGGGVNAKSYAIGMVTTTFTNLDSNYNDFYSAGANAGFFRSGSLGSAAGTDYPNLAGWQAAVSDDANSQEVDPIYVNPLNDLHLDSATTPLLGDGITGFATNDFDGETRDNPPDIGADEIVTAAPAGTVQFSSATYSVGEGGGMVTLTVTRTGGSNGAVTVNYTLGGGTATGGAACTAGVDYINTGGSVMFANGDTADKTFNVSICDDSIFETPDETFNATLSIGSGGATTGTPNPATVTITENDTQPTFAFSSATYLVGEGVGTASFTVTRGGALGGTDTVDAATVAGGTATGGASCTTGVDYITTSTTLTFNPTETSKSLMVTFCNDNLFETPNETVNLALSNPSPPSGLGTPNTAVVTITENDSAPSLQFSSATYSNSDDFTASIDKSDELAPSVATITVTRTGATENAVSVDYATVAGGTATGGAACAPGSGVDYVSTNGTLNFASGDLMKTFNITVCTDNLFEGDETVNLALSNPTAPAVLGTPNTAVLTIVDNETVPTLQFISATYMNSDDIARFGETTDEFVPSVATITVTRTGATDNAVSVDYATMGGTATGGASCTTGVDYITTSGTLNFAFGETMKTFNVTVCTDALFEGDETVNLVLSNPSPPATLGTPNSAVLTIVDNDAQPALQFSSATYTVGEGGGSATITVTRTGATDNAVSVNYATVAGGTATGGASCGGSVDYQNTSGTLNFVSGDTSETFTVTICDDALSEGSETVNLALSSPGGGAVLGTPNTAVLTITDNDGTPSLQFSTATDSVGEAGGTIILTVTRTGATGNAVSVDYATMGGTATSGASCTTGVDFVGTSGTLNFASGDISKTFNVTICNDNLFESNEMFTASLSNATGGAVIGSPSTETVTITENDTQPSLQFSTATDSVGEGGGTITLTVNRTGATENVVSVQYATASGTATSGAACTAGVDFIGASGTLNFVAGDTSETFNVTICEDALIEGNENFTASLSMPGGGAVIGSPSTETVTINDNDSDSTAPIITYTPIPINPMPTSLTATITDAVGVTGATIFWSINGGSFTSATCSLSGGTPQNGTWSCTITGTSNPNAVAYYVTATDAAMNTGSNPAGGATAPNLFTIGAATVPAGTYTNMNLGHGVSLGGNVVVNSNLTLGGVVNTGANTLTLECGATITGGGEFKYVVGNLEKRFCGIDTFTFHVGAPFPMPPLSPEDTTLSPEGAISNYSPLTVTITAGTVGSSLTVSVTDAFMLGTVQTNSISRYWTVTENGNLTADMSYTYRNEDVNGTETSYNVLRREVGTAVYPGGTVNAATNTATAPGVTNFSQWGAGVLAPTAANVSVSGQVRSGKSLLKGVLVMISGGGLSEPRTVRTNNFGNYSFEGIPVGQTYVVQVFSGRYTFPQPSIVLNVDDNVTDVDFLAEEP